MVNSPDRRPIYVRRYPWWALVLVAFASVFNWSLGHFWIGRWAAGLFWLLAWLLCTNLLTLFGTQGLFALPWGDTLYRSTGIGVVVLGLVSGIAAAMRLNRSGPRPRRRVRLVACMASFGLFFLAGFVIEHRAGMRIESYRIASHAMEPTLAKGDLVLANTLAFRDAEPVPGDLVLARWKGDTEKRVASRVIVGPGHTVAFFEGQPYIDGVEVRQVAAGTRTLDDGTEITLLREILPDGRSYLVAETADWRRATNVPPVTIGPGHWFLVGDFRDSSVDSRHLGSVARAQLAGRLLVAFGPDGTQDLSPAD